MPIIRQTTRAKLILMKKESPDLKTSSSYRSKTRKMNNQIRYIKVKGRRWIARILAEKL